MMQLFAPAAAVGSGTIRRELCCNTSRLKHHCSHTPSWTNGLVSDIQDYYTILLLVYRPSSLYRNCPPPYLVSTVPRLPRPRRAATRSDAISRAGCLQVNCQFANDWPVPRAASRTRHGRTTLCCPSASVFNQPNCLQCNSAPFLLLFAYPIPNSSKLPSRATTFITQSTTNTTNFSVRVRSLWMRVPRT